MKQGSQKELKKEYKTPQVKVVELQHRGSLMLDQSSIPFVI